MVPTCREEIPVATSEVAGDVLARDDRLDPLDGPAMTLGDQRRAFDAMETLELHVTRVEETREMRRRAGGFPATDRTVIEHHDRFAFASEEIGGGESSDAGADDTDVCGQVVLQRRDDGHVGRRHPE